MNTLVAGVIACLSVPVWIYLQYQIMVRVQATELMWFLFYAYAPLVFLGAFISALGSKK